MTRRPANSHRSLTSMDTYTQNGEGRRFKPFKCRPRGNHQTKHFTDPTAVSELRLHTNHCLTDPPARGSAEPDSSFSSVLGSETASPASATGPPSVPDTLRRLSDRDQSLELLPCGGRTYTKHGCNSLRSRRHQPCFATLRCQAVWAPRSVGLDSVSNRRPRRVRSTKVERGRSCRRSDCELHNKVRHVYKRTRIRRRSCMMYCTVCMEHAARCSARLPRVEAGKQMNRHHQRSVGEGHGYSKKKPFVCCQRVM